MSKSKSMNYQAIGKLTVVEMKTLATVLLDPGFQSLIGCGDWALTEDAEETLWQIIKKVETK
jgi:hypothetical protein